jgi:hypothetical protein
MIGSPCFYRQWQTFRSRSEESLKKGNGFSQLFEEHQTSQGVTATEGSGSGEGDHWRIGHGHTHIDPFKSSGDERGVCGFFDFRSHRAQFGTSGCLYIYNIYAICAIYSYSTYMHDVHDMSAYTHAHYAYMHAYAGLEYSIYAWYAIHRWYMHACSMEHLRAVDLLVWYACIALYAIYATYDIWSYIVRSTL